MNANRRSNPEVTENLESDIISLRGTIAKLEQRATIKYMPGWQSLAEEVGMKLKVCDSALDNFQTLTDKARDFILKERIDLKWFLSSVEDVETEIVALSEQLRLREKALDERKSATANL